MTCLDCVTFSHKTSQTARSFLDRFFDLMYLWHQWTFYCRRRYSIPYSGVIKRMGLYLHQKRKCACTRATPNKEQHLNSNTWTRQELEVHVVQTTPWLWERTRPYLGIDITSAADLEQFDTVWWASSLLVHSCAYKWYALNNKCFWQQQYMRL